MVGLGVIPRPAANGAALRAPHSVHPRQPPSPGVASCLARRPHLAGHNGDCRFPQTSHPLPPRVLTHRCRPRPSGDRTPPCVSSTQYKTPRRSLKKIPHTCPLPGDCHLSPVLAAPSSLALWVLGYGAHVGPRRVGANLTQPRRPPSPRHTEDRLCLRYPTGPPDHKHTLRCFPPSQPKESGLAKLTFLVSSPTDSSGVELWEILLGTQRSQWTASGSQWVLRFQSLMECLAALWRCQPRPGQLGGGGWRCCSPFPFFF